MANHKTKVVIVGAVGVGKSCFLNTFMKNEGTTEEFLAIVRPTVSPDIVKRTVDVDGTELRLEIWDTSGEEWRCKDLSSTFYRKANATIVMYDVTNPSSYREINFWADQARRMSGNDNLVLTLVGNKIDMRAGVFHTMEMEAEQTLTLSASNTPKEGHVRRRKKCC
ncbi:uncharacterized protein LOC135385462 isoform X4 [Ornithodoros turicata]|uniref:uncharacterized protein LOC135385462 isoform X4 n=1 Tax=Ornithodoros turicata TaxID=34597 RepID=UPI003139471C